MPTVDQLLDRIESEFTASEKQLNEFRNQEIKDFQGRQERLELFADACHTLRDIWRPRLEALAAKFGDKVKVTPTISPTARVATMAFQSPLAAIELTFTASTDFDVNNLVLDYHLHVLPILMKFNPHAQAEFPLTKIDSEAVGRWIDDRIVDFVKTYLALNQNEYYLKEHMVSDPISRTRFPKYAAAEVLDWQGAKYYFIGSETLNEFKKQKGI